MPALIDVRATRGEAAVVSSPRTLYCRAPGTGVATGLHVELEGAIWELKFPIQI